MRQDIALPLLGATALLAACGSVPSPPSATEDTTSVSENAAGVGDGTEFERGVVTTACEQMPRVGVAYDGPVAPSAAWLADESDLVAVVDVAQADECVLTSGREQGFPYAVSRVDVVTVISGTAPSSGQLTLVQPLGDQSESREVEDGERLLMFLAQNGETEVDRAPIMEKAYVPVLWDQGIADFDGNSITFRGGLGQSDLEELTRSLSTSVDD